jgi:signal transduction histidine kinase
MPDSPIVVEDGPEVLVVADSARMEQVVADVYAHAARLSLGDTITVAVDAVMPDPDQRSGGDAGRGGGSGGQVTVTVTVIGRPLTFEEASELFEPYGRSDTSTGTGLGLFLCRALLAAHGGEIGLRSSGSTSEFWFRLPCSGPPSGPLVERL